MCAGSEEGKGALAGFWPLSSLSLLPPFCTSRISSLLSTYLASWCPFWVFLYCFSRSHGSLGSEDLWGCLPTMSFSHQPDPMKSRVISSTKVFKKTYSTEKLFLANSGLVVSKGKAYVHAPLCASETYLQRAMKRQLFGIDQISKY